MLDVWILPEMTAPLGFFNLPESLSASLAMSLMRFRKRERCIKDTLSCQQETLPRNFRVQLDHFKPTASKKALSTPVQRSSRT